MVGLWLERSSCSISSAHCWWACGVSRPGHRTGWITDTLALVRDQIDPATYKKLTASLTLLLGIDPVVVMTDIAGAVERHRERVHAVYRPGARSRHKSSAASMSADGEG